MSGLTLDEIKRIDNIPLNFISGKERSGTTLLQIMLNTHPNVVAPPESRFMILLYSKYGKIQLWNEKSLTNFCNDVLEEKSIKNFWGINKEDLLTSFLAAKDIATYPLLCKLVFYHFSPGKYIKMFFDKNPIYAYYSSILVKLFPTAKYIHLVRDYRANIVSHRRVFIIKGTDDITYRWLKINQLIEESKERNPKSYFALKYEELVSEPIKSLKGICDFLHIPFYEEMAIHYTENIYKGFRANNKERFRKIHESVFAPLTNSHIDEWQRTLTSPEIQDAERIAGEFADKKYGYKRQSPTDSGRTYSVRPMTMLKYNCIKAIYMIVLNNPWLYYKITKYGWKYF